MDATDWIQVSIQADRERGEELLMDVVFEWISHSSGGWTGTI